jgi:alkylation response protein AidB-like acyl-CoA dehydrogenase
VSDSGPVVEVTESARSRHEDVTSSLAPFPLEGWGVSGWVGSARPQPAPAETPKPGRDRCRPRSTLELVSRDGLTVEQREIRELVRALAHERIAPRAAEIDRSAEFPWDVVELYRENGLFGLMFETEHGGAHAGAVATLLAIEEISKVCATSGLILAGQELGSLGIKLAGTDEQKHRFLPKLASGEWLAAYALTEAGAGSDSGAIRSEARREGDDYVLNGSKRFITNAGIAHLYICFATTDPDAGHDGISAFVVEAGTPGFEVGRIEPKMGIKGSTTGELFFVDCRVPARNMLGEEGEGFRLAMRILDRSRPGVAAQGLGIAQGATDHALAYAKTRETFGKPIGRHQLVAAMLADMETKCEAARGLLHRCGRTIDEGIDGPELTKLSAMAKVFCTDVAMEVTTDAVQVLGGYGYMQEYPVERMMRDAKITQIYEGTNQIQRLVIARELFKEPRAFLSAGT